MKNSDAPKFLQPKTFGLKFMNKFKSFENLQLIFVITNPLKCE